MDTIIKGLIVGGVGAISSLFAPAQPFLKALILLMMIDYITGVLAATVTNNLSSKRGMIGIFKKVCTFLVVAAVIIVDPLAELGGTLYLAVIWCFIANETISIIENAAIVGVPVPTRMKEVLEVLKTKRN